MMHRARHSGLSRRLGRMWARVALGTRLMLGASLALIVAGSLLLLVSARQEADYAKTQIEERLASEMESLLPAITEWAVTGDYASIEQYIRRLVKHPDILYVGWKNAQGQLLEAIDKDEELRAPEWFARWSGVIAPAKGSPLTVGGRVYGKVMIEMTATPSHNRLWGAFLNQLAILALALAIDLAGILLILRSELRPLAALTKGANEFGSGDYSHRIAQQGSQEVLRLIDAFNRMADGIAAAQSALLQQAERLAVTLTSIADGVIATDAVGRVEFMNPVAEVLTGWRADEARGRSIAEIFVLQDESSGEKIDCPVWQAMRDGATVALRARTLLIGRDGVARPIADSAAPIRHADQHVLGAVLVFRDQTEERRTLARLDLAASVFDNSLNGITITDGRHRIIEVNPAFARITGYTRDEVLGKTPNLLSSGRHDSHFYSGIWSDVEASGHWQGEIWNRHKDGSIYPEELSIVAARDDKGKLIRYIGIFSDISQIKKQEALLQSMAHYDPLTGLPNRVLLADRMKIALAQTDRSGEKLAVCYLDLDGFKPVNDTWGHAIGDRLLTEVASRLRSLVRGGDTAARLGGDEFAILLANLHDVPECEAVLARLLHTLAQPIIIDGNVLTVTASIGVTIFPDDGGDADTLLRHADQSLYVAKETGRNRYHLFDPRHDLAARKRRSDLTRLEQALADGEFCLYYQPKVDMRAGTVIGAEALIRWRHPERDIIGPAEFLPLLAGTALEIEVGEWVINTALRQMSTWRAIGIELAVAVNIAPPHLARADFIERLMLFRARYPDTPDNGLQLEVLESVALEDIEHVSRLIETCRRHGIAFALDDFGTGYSSLTYLKRLPVDLLKIDQSFVRDMLDNAEDMAIIDGVISLARAFRIHVIAEGVETVQQGLALIERNCTLGQGYAIARPMPAQELPDWIAGWKPDPSWSK